ncbi:hypothetical protein U8V72_20150 [Priestia filamentosa]|uniref:hypothetical protein n=1 Tax=Priestia filamentosa TaxID=1402861 RepID=UPI00397C72EF
MRNNKQNVLNLNLSATTKSTLSNIYQSLITKELTIEEYKEIQKSSRREPKQYINGETLFMRVLSIGNELLAHYILDNEEVNINQTDKYGQSAIGLAARYSSLQLFKKVYDKVDKGKLPVILHIEAIRQDNINVLKWLADREKDGIQSWMLSRSGYNLSLEVAIKSSSTQCVEYLLRYEDNINRLNFVDESYIVSLFSEEISKEKREETKIIFEMIMRRRPDLTIKSLEGYSAFYYASLRGCYNWFKPYMHNMNTMELDLYEEQKFVALIHKSKV